MKYNPKKVKAADIIGTAWNGMKICSNPPPSNELEQAVFDAWRQIHNGGLNLQRAWAAVNKARKENK